MFENAFSFEGRIRRTEYGISGIIYGFFVVVINLIISGSDGDLAILGIAYIPMLWFFWAQGAKRCHDVGNSGWWQLIPFYGFWLLFQDGDYGQNKYGNNPKETLQNTINCGAPHNQQSTKPAGGYNQGSYSGGHNNQNNSDFSNNKSNSSYSKTTTSGEYNSGELYK